MTFFYYSFLFLFLFLCVILCLIILAQESKSSGLGASFGGDTGESMFGASTPEVLKKITGWISFFFMAGCILLSFWTGAIGRGKTKSDQTRTEIQR